MASLYYCRGSNIPSLTWTLQAGLVLAGYGVARLVDQDPSYPLWLEDMTVDARSDQGSAQRIDGFVVYHHNFAEGTTLRFQMHSDFSSWAGATDVDLSVDVGPWMGRFAPHVFFHVADAYSEATRTKRYLRFTNTDANDVAIQIGEFLPLAEIEALTHGVLVEPTKSLVYGRSLATGKKGPVYIHDRRTRDRRWTGKLLPYSLDRGRFTEWQDDSYGVRPFVCWPENDIEGEPIFARFTSPLYERTLVTEQLDGTTFEIEELSCGEAH